MNMIKKIWQSKYFKNYILLMVSLTIVELLFRIIENLTVFSYASLRIFIGINIVSLLFSYILSFLRPIVAKIVNVLLVGFVSIYGIAQLGFSSFLGVYASVQTKSQMSAVTSFISLFIESLKWYYYLLLVPFILLLLYYILFDKRVSIDLPKKKLNITRVTVKFFNFLIIVFLCLCYFSTLKLEFMQNKLQAVSSYELLKKPTLPSLVINDFGLIGFGILDIKEYIAPGKVIETINYNPSNIGTITTSDPSLEVYGSNATINNDYWKDIIATETNETLNNLNKYFISNKVTEQNAQTGMFAGKNLIVIMLESGSNLILNEEYYPNMARLMSGWSWDNYYSPRNTCSTGNNEMSGITGLYSIYNNCTANVYQKNKYFESIFNLFNDAGYTTSSYHNHYDTYYDRTVIHPNMGSGKFYKLQDLNIPYNKKNAWASDEDLMNAYLSILDERDTTKPFMSWITTVTSHHPYNNANLYNDMYIDLFPEDLPKDVRRYMSKLKVVDNALGILLAGLEERGILDDTVIAIFADHYPYAISSENLNEVFEYDVSVDYNFDQVPFLIYNTEIETEHYQEYTSYVNITPTLANLFSLSYDSRLYMGEDLFNKNYESLVIFADGSWKNEVAFYDAASAKINYYTQKLYTDEEILAINEKVSLKLKMSSLAIEENYFNYLDKKLQSYEILEEEVTEIETEIDTEIETEIEIENEY